MNPEQVLAATCEQTVSTLTAALVRYGYRVERSFDLRSALDSHHDCPCPHHNTIHCTCQYVVLLVHEAANTPPASVTAHECDGITRLHVEAGQPGGTLSPQLASALDEAMTAIVIERDEPGLMELLKPPSPAPQRAGRTNSTSTTVH